MGAAVGHGGKEALGSKIMLDMTSARVNMVSSQLHTNQVTDEKVLSAFQELPRERFVPADMASIAYVDEDLPIGSGRCLTEPMVLARLIQAANPVADEIALNVACGSGYASAVLAHMGLTVVALENNGELAELARKNLSALELDSAIVVEGPVALGHAEQGPYNVILIDGAVEYVPDAILDQLADGGRLVTVVREGRGTGRATLFLKSGDHVAQQVLFDASLPLFSDFRKAAEFTF
jgi:protein-L-isoaspartate(D-aspartate) O-methyltransferase